MDIDMDIRKTRLDYMWKMCALCPPVMGTLIVYFYQNAISFPDAGEIILLGFLSFVTLFFTSSCWYLYKELLLFQNEKTCISLEKTTSADEAYKGILNAIKFGGGCLLIYGTVLAIKYLYQFEWIKMISTNTSFFTAMVSLSLFAFRIPKNKQIQICCLPLHIKQESRPCQLTNTEKQKIFIVHTNTIKNIGWISFGVFLFNLFYSIWFI